MCSLSRSEPRTLRPSNIDMRDAFFDTLYEIAAGDPDVLLLTDDQGAFGVERIKRELEGQYFNVGIAEQNLVSVAAGLALGGKRPFIYGISTFMTMRCCEQINVDLCCLDLPVTIVASGAGYTYSGDGPTHHAIQDIAILRSLPKMSILSPSDAVMTSKLARIAYETGGPKYVRIEKGILPAIYDEGEDFSAGFEVLRTGGDLVIVSTGVMVSRVLEVADKLAERSVNVGVVDLYRVKPIDTSSLLAVLSRVDRVVTVEEHSIVGGIGSIIAEGLADAGRPTPLKRIALPDRHCYQYGSREWLHSRNGLDTDSITRTILEWVQSSVVL